MRLGAEDGVETREVETEEGPRRSEEDGKEEGSICFVVEDADEKEGEVEEEREEDGDCFGKKRVGEER